MDVVSKHILFITYIVSYILNLERRACPVNLYRGSSKNEVILPSDGRGSMACNAVPRVMMYQGNARVPLEAEAILRGLR